MKSIAVIVLAFSFSAPSLARGQEPPAPLAAVVQAPPSGEAPIAPPFGYLVAGGILTFLGMGNFATATICKTSVVVSERQDACMIESVVFGSTLLFIGGPLLIVGQEKYNKWKARQPVAAGLGFFTTKSGVVLTFGSQF